jgi:predicted nucleotidyltransferase component of viral defense system
LREHFALFERASVPFAVSSSWFTGSADISTYHLDELLGTKLRALYQSRKGRDLFDLAIALKNPSVDPARIVEAFLGYMEKEEGPIA